MNDRIAGAPVKLTRKNIEITMINGCRVDRRFSSEHLSTRVGGGWVHCKLCLMHKLHDFEFLLCRCRSVNSSAIACSVAHPRSQHNDFSACLVRFFDSNHCGVSGTYKSIHIIVTIITSNTHLNLIHATTKKLTKHNRIVDVMGTNKQTNATVLQAIQAFRMYTVNIPRPANKFEKATRVPRSEGSL